eukprot:2886891-Pleurochrysis_carterae.AAC.1
MHPRPLPQGYPPQIPPPVEMSRHSAAHEVVHVSAVLVHVVVADPPTISRRTFCLVSRVMHALF